jgi:hypothetical protein
MDGLDILNSSDLKKAAGRKLVSESKPNHFEESDNRIYCIKQDNLKYIHASSPARRSLFDLEQSPDEMIDSEKNQIWKMTELADELTRYLQTIPRDANVPTIKMPKNTEQNLRALGYLE